MKINEMVAKKEGRSPTDMFIATAIIAIGVSVVFAFFRERPFYLKHLGTVLYDVNYYSATLGASVTFYLVAKSLLLMSPVLLAVAVLARRKKQAVAYLLFCIGAMVCFGIQWIDMTVLHATGNHVRDYATFALSPQAWEWAGQGSRWKQKAGVQATLISVEIAATVWVLRMAGKLLSSRTSWATNLSSRGVFGCYLVITIGGLFGAESIIDQRVSTEFRSALPIALPSLRSMVGWDARTSAAKASEEVEDAYRFAQPRLASPVEVDDRTLAAEKKPHVVVFVLESLRNSLCEPQVMPNVVERGREGTMCDMHYSSSNCSQFGVFSLLYGRWPVAYEQTLTDKIKPQLCVTLKSLGYTTTFVTSADNTNYRRMGEYLNEHTFDRVAQFTDGDWPARDRESLAETRRILAASNGRPQFVFVFLMSTHFGYEFPQEFGKFAPYPAEVDFLDPNIDKYRDGVLNRYKNSAHFLDHEIGRVLKSIDKDEAIVVVTGDHGESIREDGTYGHASKMSDVQLRTPFVISGPRVPQARSKYLTSHVDLLPTVLHLVHGESVRLSGSHGDSIYDRSRSSGVMCVNGGFFFHLYQEWDDILVVDRMARQRFLIHRGRPTIHFLGLLDRSARVMSGPDKLVEIPESSTATAAGLLKRIGAAEGETKEDRPDVGS